MEHENTMSLHSTLITHLQNQLNEGQRSVGEKLIRIKCYEREMKSLMREIKLREEFTQQQKERNDFLANENQRLAEQLDIIKEENLVLDNELNITQQLQIRKKDDLEKTKLKYTDIFEKWALSQRNIKEYFLKEEEGYLQIVELKQQKESLQDQLANVMLDAEKAEKKYEDTKANVDKIVEYNKLIANNENLRKEYEALCAEWLKLAQIQEIRKTHAVDKEKNEFDDNMSPACSGIAPLRKSKPAHDIRILQNVNLATKRKAAIELSDQSNGKLSKMDNSIVQDSFQFFNDKEQLSDDFPDFFEIASPVSSPNCTKEKNNTKNTFFCF